MSTQSNAHGIEFARLYPPNKKDPTRIALGPTITPEVMCNRSRFYGLRLILKEETLCPRVKLLPAVELPVGLEPTTCRLQDGCSAY